MISIFRSLGLQAQGGRLHGHHPAGEVIIFGLSRVATSSKHNTIVSQSCDKDNVSLFSRDKSAISSRVGHDQNDRTLPSAFESHMGGGIGEAPYAGKTAHIRSPKRHPDDEDANDGQQDRAGRPEIAQALANAPGAQRYSEAVSPGRGDYGRLLIG